MKKEKEKEDDKKAKKKAPIITNKTPSNISSKTSKSGEEKKKSLSKHLKILKAFLELYGSFKVKYQKLNIIYIIDGFFTKDFFTTIKDFANRFVSGKIEKCNFDLWFAQIESDAIFVHESNVVNKIRNNLENFKTESNQKIKDLQLDYQKFQTEYEKLKGESEDFKIKSEEIYENLQTESEQKYNNFKSESEQKYNNLNSESGQRYKALQDNYDRLNERYEMEEKRKEI